MAFLGRTVRLQGFKFQDNLQVGEHEQLLACYFLKRLRSRSEDGKKHCKIVKTSQVARTVVGSGQAAPFSGAFVIVRFKIFSDPFMI